VERRGGSCQYQCLCCYLLGKRLKWPCLWLRWRQEEKELALRTGGCCRRGYKVAVSADLQFGKPAELEEGNGICLSGQGLARTRKQVCVLAEAREKTLSGWSNGGGMWEPSPGRNVRMPPSCPPKGSRPAGYGAMDVIKAWSWRNAESVMDLCSSSQRYAFNRPCLPRLICVAPVQLSSRVDVRPCTQTPSSAAVFSRLFAPSRVCHVDNRPMTPGVRVGKGLRMFVDLSFPLGRAAARFHVRRRARAAQLLEENQRCKSHLGLHGGMWSCVCVLALNKVVECNVGCRDRIRS